jgi:hypothetical protein
MIRVSLFGSKKQSLEMIRKKKYTFQKKNDRVGRQRFDEAPWQLWLFPHLPKLSDRGSFFQQSSSTFE